MKSVLTIAGSDCSGGAGIQADIKTITVHKLYAMSAITALTAQNTTGVFGVEEVSPEFVAQQIDCVFTDIRPDAVKIGMVSGDGIIKAIAERLRFYQSTNIVLDPVMVATSGGKLISNGAIEALVKELFPIAGVITPNIPEAEILSGMKITEKKDMIPAAEKLSSSLPGAVLIKGGHLDGDASDLLYKEGICTWYSSERVDNPNTHGTGCTLSSAIACNLALGFSIEDSVRLAKEYLTNILKAGLNLGKGSGPLSHAHLIP
jgi:phosphomethylpyrimidine kinase